MYVSDEYFYHLYSTEEDRLTRELEQRRCAADRLPISTPTAARTKIWHWKRRAASKEFDALDELPYPKDHQTVKPATPQPSAC